ncbi:MAG: MFS transporter [Magnetococcales bacterium]|nr:MFS transporter [Magnetococcales bacterium]MBF0156283.1 MFS transporter [Magnetococcales bacterium]
MLAMVVLVGMGERLADRFLPIYILAVGGGTLAVGLLGAMENLLGALYAFPGGYLSDRWGPKRALLFFNLLAASGFLLVVLVPTWQALLVGAAFFLSWSAVSMPAVMGLIGDALPKQKQVMGVSVHAMVRRIPMALGPLLGGLLVARFGEREGIRIAFVVALLLCLVAAWVLHRSMPDSPSPASAREPERNPFRLWRFMTLPLRRLLVADILVRFCEQIPNAFVVIWCLKVASAPVSATEFGLLSMIEMTTSLLIYIPVGWMADRGGKKGFVLATFVFFSLFPLLLLFSHSFWPLVAAFVLRGLKEFGEPTRKAMIMELAPEGRKAALFGLYYLIRDLFVAVSALAGAWLWQLGPEVNLLSAFGFGIAGTIWFAWRGVDLDATAAADRGRA